MKTYTTYKDIDKVKLEQELRSLVSEVCDPEIPVLSIADLGLIRDIQISDDAIEIVLTPTYSGCPAMDAIAMDIKMKLLTEGHRKVNVSYQLQPAWTTDWMTATGKRKLQEYGIAPPPRLRDKEHFQLTCPRCHSINTKTVSDFGSTACKSLCQCNDCLEFFDHFKCH